MSMMHKLFRPRPGHRPQRFCAAFVNGTTSYRGDVAVWDTTAPTSQGASGVLEGRTLRANDFIYVTIAPATASNSYGRLAGVYEGTTIGDTDTVNNLADDACVIVQTWGVHDTVRTVDATVATGALLTMSTTAGAAADGASSTLEGGMVGVALTEDTTYTRGTATTENKVTGFIRCDA
jgi:hypothetical protein